MATPIAPAFVLVDRRAGVARRVVALLVEAGVVGDVDHAGPAEQRAVRVDDRRAIERAVAVALVQIQHDDDAEFARAARERIRGRARHRLARAATATSPAGRCGKKRSKASSANTTSSAPSPRRAARAPRARERRWPAVSAVAACCTSAIFTPLSSSPAPCTREIPTSVFRVFRRLSDTVRSVALDRLPLPRDHARAGEKDDQ